MGSSGLDGWLATCTPVADAAEVQCVRHLADEQTMGKSTGVSVVIPAYNYGRFLGAAIESVLAQEYPELEVIVVDDGSTDNTAEIVSKYGSPVRRIYQANAGLSAARNTGIRDARYPFVGFLDADDIWLPGMLQRVMAKFASLPEEYAIVASRWDTVDVDGRPVSLKSAHFPIEGEITVLDLIHGSRFAASAPVVRRSAFQQCGYFDVSLTSTEDRDMWIRIAAQNRVYLMDKPGVLFRRHSTSMSRNADRMRFNMRRVILKAYHDRLVPRRHLVFWMQAASLHFYQIAMLYHGVGRSWAALRDMIFSLACWPWVMTPRAINTRLSVIRLRTLARICLGIFRMQPE
jgi:glycosyltransferase involved in cell wall biosynthesis